jgi:hypothetical protein
MPNRFVFSQEEFDSWPDGYRKCTGCKDIKSLEEFHKRLGAPFGRASRCKYCARPEAVKRHREMSSELRLYKSAKQRATREGTPFTIAVSDIIVPKTCPILGIKLRHNEGKQGDSSPSLDKVIPELGYIPGNIAVISLRANIIKDKYSYAELNAVTSWLGEFLEKRKA